jgi:hypothetical protein
MMTDSSPRRQFVTMGMFMIDNFELLDAGGRPTGESREPQVRENVDGAAIK